METNKILEKIKSKYLKDKEFKKEFDLNKEKAIEKHFSSKTLKELKASFGNNISQANMKLLLSNKEQLNDNALEGIAGGKDKKKPKDEVVYERYEDRYQKNNFGLELNNTRTGGDVKLEDNTQIFKI